MIGDPFNLSGKTAVVTGAGQGLGLEFALALADAEPGEAVSECLVDIDLGHRLQQQLVPHEAGRLQQAGDQIGRQQRNDELPPEQEEGH